MWCSLETSGRDNFIEFPQHKFMLKNKKKIVTENVLEFQSFFPKKDPDQTASEAFVFVNSSLDNQNFI